MKLRVLLLNHKKVELKKEGERFSSKDTISNWIIQDSNENIIAIFDKFSTVYISLED